MTPKRTNLKKNIKQKTCFYISFKNASKKTLNEERYKTTLYLCAYYNWNNSSKYLKSVFNNHLFY